MAHLRGVLISTGILLVISQLCQADITQSSWKRGQNTKYEVNVEIPLNEPLGRNWNLYLSFDQSVIKVNDITSTHQIDES